MSYTDLPPAVPAVNGNFGMTIVGREELKECCLQLYAVQRPSLLGTKLQCLKCSNILTTEMAKAELWENAENKGFIGTYKVMREGTVIQSIQYNKPYWTQHTVDNDLQKRGLNKTYMQDSLQSVTVVNRPVSWFEEKTIQISSPENGVTVAIGKIKDEYKDKIPEASEVSNGLVDNGIETLY